MKTNGPWVFDENERKKREKRENEKIKIVQVYRNPSDFRFGEWLVEEVSAIGGEIVYLITGVDIHDGSRSKCVKYSVKKNGGEDGTSSDQREQGRG